VADLGRLFGREVALSWRTPATSNIPRDALALRVPADELARAAARVWGAPPAEEWEGSLTSALTNGSSR
jgi:hypothetical protein